MNMYFVALVLPEDVNAQVLQWKNYMKQHYDCQVALRSRAHITLIPPFWMGADKEPSIINNLDSISNHLPCIRLKTCNFSAFKPRTIFIATEPNPDLSKLKGDVDTFFAEKGYPLKVDKRPFRPHITIATRDLHKRDFFEAWPYFEQKKFEEEFVISTISLLRHNKVNWDVIHSAELRQSKMGLE